jgi:hypothetical protein
MLEALLSNRLFTQNLSPQHQLLVNRFLIRKYTQPLSSNAFAKKHVAMETIGTTAEELCFLLVRAERLYGGQLEQEFRIVRESVKKKT